MSQPDTTARVLSALRSAPAGLTLPALCRAAGADPTAATWSLARLAVLRAVASRGPLWFAR